MIWFNAGSLHNDILTEPFEIVFATELQHQGTLLLKILLRKIVKVKLN